MAGNMSENWLPRTPAHSSLRPSAPVWVTAESALASDVCTWSGITGKVMRMESRVEAPLGYYRLGKNLDKFVKIIPLDHSELQISSDRMAAWLEQNNIAVCRLLTGFPRIFEQKYAVLAYDYIDGRFSNSSPSDIEALGLSLGELHNALFKCPYREEIRKAGNSRNDRLIRRLTETKKGHPDLPVPTQVQRILGSTSPELLRGLTDRAQVIHGDLNYGNILFKGSEPVPVFLDFEDSWSAWFSPIMDLAMVIERFILGGSESNTIALSKLLLEAYYSVSDNRFECPEELGLMLKGMSVRAILLLLLTFDDNPEKVTDSEWGKFVHLYRETDIQADLLRRIATQ